MPASQVFARPRALSVEQAAAFPATHLTAWHALVDLGRLRAGETVLVHSAAGGVGTAACGLAARLGAKAIGVVGGGHKVEVVERLLEGESLRESAERIRPRARGL